MVADRQRQLVDLTGAIDRIDGPDILAQLAGAEPTATMAASISLMSAMVSAEIVSL
jgi:hypothetical protein